jgi:hypothetical protein
LASASLRAPLSSTRPCCERRPLPLPHLHRYLAQNLPHLHRDWAHLSHICPGTAPATSFPRAADRQSFVLCGSRAVSLASQALHRRGIRHRPRTCTPSAPTRLRLAPTNRAGLCRNVFTCTPFGRATPGTHSFAAGSGPVECHSARSGRAVASEASLRKCLRRLLLLLMPALLERQRSSAAAGRLACARSLAHIFWPAGTCAGTVS